MTTEREKTRLMILDGNNIVMRSYHALWKTDLRTSKGEPTGALHGTINAMRQYLRVLAPTHLVWFFDDGQSVLRTGLRDDYKGHRKTASVSTEQRRPNPADDLPPQYEALRQFFDICQVRHHSEHGVEADDLIARAVNEAYDDFDEIVIVSGDHDMLQLATDKVKILRPGEAPPTRPAVRGMAGLAATDPIDRLGVLYDDNRVLAKYGLGPTQLAEMWALTGDTGDNIKGIPGVGPKTAAKWMRAYGSLNSVLVNEPKCEGYERQCYVNWQMINLDGSVGHVPFPCVAASLKHTHSINAKDLFSFLQRWELHSVLDAMIREGL